MEVCEQRKTFPREQAPSILEIKNKIRVGHNECCNCCCCKPLAHQAFRYVQPEVPKSFRPINCYRKPECPIEKATTYKLSYWNNPADRRAPIVPEGCLTVAQGPFARDTTHQMSYLGNWTPKQEKPILPCKPQLLGRGPMQDCTTQKVDFTWKYEPKREPLKNDDGLCFSPCPLEKDTTYKLSYYNSNCTERVKSFAPIKCYKPSTEPLEGFTTYKLSFFDNGPVPREQHHWQKPLKYEKPSTKVDTNTTYKLSYWPQCEPARGPLRVPSQENLLSQGPCFDDKTTYELSYLNGCGDRPSPILPVPNKIFDDCPLAYDTVNRMSYFGNWDLNPVKPIFPCKPQLLGRGPMQDCTTQKVDFTWKYQDQTPNLKPPSHIHLSTKPLECCTTNRLSYMANCQDYLVPAKSYAPIKKYEPSDMPMDMDTTMQLSYQPVCDPPKTEKPWAKAPPYTAPTTHVDGNTTYSLSFMPPGVLRPCVPCKEDPCQNSCANSMRPQVSITTDTRPIISC